MTKYFSNIHTTEELKKAYHEAIKATHPDKGGSYEAECKRYELKAQTAPAAMACG